MLSIKICEANVAIGYLTKIGVLNQEKKKKKNLAFLLPLLWIFLKTFLLVGKWKINCVFSCASSSTFLTQTVLRCCSKNEIKWCFFLQIHRKNVVLTSFLLEGIFGKNAYSFFLYCHIYMHRIKRGGIADFLFQSWL